MYEESTLVNAINKNNFEEARLLIENGEKLPKSINSFSKKQIYNTLVRGKAFELINILIKNGIIETDLYEYDSFEDTIFESLLNHLENKEEDLNFLQNFLEKADNINETLKDETLLGFALKADAPIEVIKTLAQAGCDIQYKNNYEENLLHKVVQQNSNRNGNELKYLDFFIQEDLDINMGNISGRTPLHMAIDYNKSEYIDLLLQNGADPNQQDKEGRTPFYTALVWKGGDLDTYKKLKEFVPVDFELTTKEGETLLAEFVRQSGLSNSELTDLLLEMIQDGADLYQDSVYYGKPKSALDWISEPAIAAEVLQSLLESEAIELDHKDNQGNTLLHKICAFDVNYDQEAAKQIYRKVKLLIEKGAALNITNDLDQTPMELALQDNLKTKTVELLLKNKA